MNYYNQQLTQLRWPTTKLARRKPGLPTPNVSDVSSLSSSIILSDEYLYETPMIRWQSWMPYLATTLQYHVIIVAYCRNFVDYSLSRFSQCLKKLLEWPTVSLSLSSNNNKTHNLNQTSLSTTTTTTTMIPDIITYFQQEAQHVLLAKRQQYDPYRAISLAETRNRHASTSSSSNKGDGSISFRMLDFHNVHQDPATQFFCRGLPPNTGTRKYEEED